jgi:hypothetical protein
MGDEKRFKMTTIIEKKEFPGIDNFEKDISIYMDDFLKKGVIVFSKANLSENEQGQVSVIINKYFGLYPQLVRDIPGMTYRENHKALTKMGRTEDQIMLQWHVDHPQYINPICIGVWNMHKLNLKNYMAGRTFFYDLRKAYNQLTEEEKEFSKKCFTNFIGGDCLYVSKHFATDEYTVRALNSVDLVLFDGRTPTRQEKEYFYEIVTKVKDLFGIKNSTYDIADLEDIFELRWEKGDLAIVDMFVSAHSVSGGYSEDERLFTGIWSRYKDQNELSDNFNVAERDTDNPEWPPPEDILIDDVDIYKKYTYWKELWHRE